MDALVKKLKELKILVIKWERKKKMAAKEELVKIEKNLDTLYTNHPEGFEEEADKVLVLEKGKKEIGTPDTGRRDMEAEESDKLVGLWR